MVCPSSPMDLALVSLGDQTLAKRGRGMLLMNSLFDEYDRCDHEKRKRGVLIGWLADLVSERESAVMVSNY